MTGAGDHPDTLAKCPECGSQQDESARGRQIAQENSRLALVCTIILVAWGFALFLLPTDWVVAVVFLPALVVFLPRFWYRGRTARRRSARGECVACGYDLKVPAASTSS